MKESAHFMRNIGIFGPTILDRHILKHLLACGIQSAKKPPTNRSSYIKIEHAWLRYCKQVNIPMVEMDLLFWALETGFILK
jgi:thermostable 8-oxoguanine DNA glycosylase